MIKKVSALTERIREAWAAQQARLPRGGKLSQSAIARDVGVVDSTIGRWRTGEMTPDTDQIKALAEALEVSHYWLAFGEGEMRGGRPDVQTSIEPTAAVPVDQGLDTGEEDQPRQVRGRGRP
ncbi:MAG: hypothetical protein C0499_02655 [Zymomonas sp.]|nr:hypothetical protein [Zymomonas sp.]